MYKKDNISLLGNTELKKGAKPMKDYICRFQYKLDPSISNYWVGITKYDLIPETSLHVDFDILDENGRVDECKKQTIRAKHGVDIAIIAMNIVSERQTKPDYSPTRKN